MAKAQQIVTDRKTMKEILEFMEEAVREGFNREEIMSQTDLLLDKEAQRSIRQSEREVREGKNKRFTTAKEAIAWLRSERD